MEGGDDLAHSASRRSGFADGVVLTHVHTTDAGFPGAGLRCAVQWKTALRQALRPVGVECVGVLMESTEDLPVEHILLQPGTGGNPLRRQHAAELSSVDAEGTFVHGETDPPVTEVSPFRPRCNADPWHTIDPLLEGLTEGLPFLHPTWQLLELLGCQCRIDIAQTLR